MNQGTSFTARPTTYNGIQMRSRLEARYAAWLDLVGASWFYEPACFASPGGQYLPDFKLEGVNVRGTVRSVYVEIKPTYELAKATIDRMPIIWKSEPSAELVLEIANVAAPYLYDRPPGFSAMTWCRTGDRLALLDEVHQRKTWTEHQ